MQLDTRHYGHGTYMVYRMPWSIHVGGRVLCTDGKLRTLKRISATADTFYSIPAAVSVKGKTISGFVTTDTDANGTQYLKFLSYGYGKNGHLLPGTKVAI